MCGVLSATDKSKRMVLCILHNLLLLKNVALAGGETWQGKLDPLMDTNTFEFMKMRSRTEFCRGLGHPSGLASCSGLACCSGLGISSQVLMCK